MLTWPGSEGGETFGRGRRVVRPPYVPATLPPAWGWARILPADVDYFGPITEASPNLPGPFADRLAGAVVLDLSPVPRWP